MELGRPLQSKLIRDWPGSAWGQGELENSVCVIKIDQGLAWERLGPEGGSKTAFFVIKLDQALAWERLEPAGARKLRFCN